MCALVKKPLQQCKPISIIIDMYDIDLLSLMLGCLIFDFEMPCVIKNKPNTKIS